MAGIPTAEENAKSILARQAEAQDLLNAAIANGDSKSIASYKAALRKLDKLINEYGLDRYA